MKISRIDEIKCSVFCLKLLTHIIFLLITIISLISKNLIFTLCYLLLIILPYLVIIVLNFKNLSKKAFKKDFKRLIDKLISSYFYIFLIFFLIGTFYPKFYDDSSKEIFIISFHFYLFFQTFILINYYSTNDISLKENIKKFLTSVEYAIKENFILNVFCLILLIYLNEYKDLFLGILGSYIFFILTEINKNYNGKSSENNIVIKILRRTQNIGLIFLCCCYEQILNSILENSFNSNINFLIISMTLNLIIIIINYKLNKFI